MLSRPPSSLATCSRLPCRFRVCPVSGCRSWSEPRVHQVDHQYRHQHHALQVLVLPLPVLLVALRRMLPRKLTPRSSGRSCQPSAAPGSPRRRPWLTNGTGYKGGPNLDLRYHDNRKCPAWSRTLMLSWNGCGAYGVGVCRLQPPSCSHLISG